MFKNLDQNPVKEETKSFGRKYDYRTLEVQEDENIEVLQKKFDVKED